MSKKYLTGINLMGSAITQVALDPLASAPSGYAGRVYFDSVLKQLAIHDGTSWNYIAWTSYVDGAIQGLKAKPSVKASSAGSNLTLSGTQTVDGVSLIAGDRILVKDQTTANQNGIYVVSASAWSRALDADTWIENVSAFVFVEQGTANADTGWLSTVDQGGTLGTTSIIFVQFSSAGQITLATDSNNIISWAKVGNTWTPTISISNLLTQLVTAGVSRRASFSCSAGTTTNCGHNFSISAVSGIFPQHVTVQEVATKQEVIVDWTATDANTTAVTFPAGTTAGQYVITIVA